MKGEEEEFGRKGLLVTESPDPLKREEANKKKKNGGKKDTPSECDKFLSPKRKAPAKRKEISNVVVIKLS